MDGNTMVYTTASSSVFHEHADCATRIDWRRIRCALGWAVGEGKRPCQVCTTDAVEMAYWEVLDQRIDD